MKLTQMEVKVLLEESYAFRQTVARRMMEEERVVVSDPTKDPWLQRLARRMVKENPGEKIKAIKQLRDVVNGPMKMNGGYEDDVNIIGLAEAKNLVEQYYVNVTI